MLVNRDGNVQSTLNVSIRGNLHASEERMFGAVRYLFKRRLETAPVKYRRSRTDGKIL